MTDWTFQNGFKFSINTTKVIHFSLSSSLVSLPDLYLENNLLPYSNSTRFLGWVWDKKLTWVPHINKLKAQCAKLLNLLRSLTSQTWGADQYCRLKLHRMFIRSKLHYGCIVYDSASRSTLLSLDTVCREALRLSCAAFRSTPIECLHALTNEMTLQERRQYLSLWFYVKIRSHLSNPAHHAVNNTRDELLFINRNISKPFALRVKDYVNQYILERTPVMPQFSYTILAINIP